MSTAIPESVIRGPGELLRETRMKLGLEPDNVAQILHLSISQIAALEDNDFDRLPGATYVRGYLRSYCQLLDIDSAPVLKSFEAATGDWKTTTYSNLVTERQVTSRDSIVRMATLGIMVVVIGLAVVWWFGKGSQPAPTREGSETEATSAAPAQIPGTEPETAAAPSAAAPEMESTAAPAQVAPEPPATAAAPEKRPERVVPPAPVASPKPAESAPSPAMAAPPEPVKSLPIKTIAGDRSRLVLATTAPSWVDIRDGSNNRLLYETVAAGRTISLQGDPPFQIFVGNADAVTLSYNGQTVDVRAHRNGPTARFVVGQSGSADKAAD